VKAFTEDRKCYIFIGSWHIGSTGLNLQTQCNHNAEWDAPPSIGAMRQARGRVRRIRQPLAIEYQSTSIRVLVLDCGIQLLVFECKYSNASIRVLVFEY
jgi:hypothetical protein